MPENVVRVAHWHARHPAGHVGCDGVGVMHRGPVTGPPSTTQQICPLSQQLVPQHVWLLWHVDVPFSQGACAHLPFSHTGLLGSHALPQEPQLNGSSSGSAHRPPQHC